MPQIRALLVSPRWWSSAPFGNPVVPEVYCTCAGSVGRTSGRRADGGAVATNASQSVNETTSRKSSSPGQTSSRQAAIGWPRYSGTKKMPDARDWRSTYPSSLDR
jgi:hypothetical protein